MSTVQRFQKILVAVGGPEDAKDTVGVVADLARAFGSEVLVVHLRERIVASGGTLEHESIPEAMAFGEGVAEVLVDRGISAMADVHGTSPDRVPDEVLTAARDFGADLIVIGPHHAHGMHQHLVGDIGRTVTDKTPCPVLLMPHDAEPSRNGGILARKAAPHQMGGERMESSGQI